MLMTYVFAISKLFCIIIRVMYIQFGTYIHNYYTYSIQYVHLKPYTVCITVTLRLYMNAFVYAVLIKITLP